MMKKKICKNCGAKKLLSDFYKYPEMKDGHSSSCKKCDNKAGREYRKTKKGKAAHNKGCRKYEKTKRGKAAGKKYRQSKKGVTAKRKYNLKQYYDMTIAEYDKMFKKQDGVCAICKQLDITGQRLSVDHNHKTGKIRGLLCHKCNLMLGGYENNRELFKEFEKYINFNR